MPKKADNEKKPLKNQTCVQMNVSVPINVYNRINEECNSLGINRSAYVTMTLNQKWQQDEFTKHLPEVLSTFTRMLDKMDAQELKGL